MISKTSSMVKFALNVIERSYLLSNLLDFNLGDDLMIKNDL